MPKQPVVFVCRKCRGSKPLLAYLERRTEARVRQVGCQKICDEPLAGLRVDGSLRWFGGLKDAEHRRAFGALVADPDRHDLPKILRKAAVGTSKLR